MKKGIYILSFLFGLLFCPGILPGQNINLVPNGSFEDSLGCMSGFNPNFNYLKYWYNPTQIPNPAATATPDYYNLCTDPFNYNYDTIIPPHSRYGRVGVLVRTFPPYTNIREYIAAELKSNLKAGKNYCFEMYATSFLLSINGTDNLGVYFGNGHQFYNINTIPPVTPQIQLPNGEIVDYSWHKLEAIYTATGNETDIMIGGFKTDANTDTLFLNDTTFYPGTSGSYQVNTNHYYNVYDDISLYEMSINSGTDALTCPENMVATIGETNTDTAFKNYYWYDAAGVLFDSINSQIQVSPTSNTFYIQEKRMCGKSFFDTVFVNIDTVCPPPPPEPPVEETELIIPNVFSPNGDGINDVWKVNLESREIQKFVIYNRWGVEQANSKEFNLKQTKVLIWDGHTTSGVTCSDGIYYYLLEFKNSKGETENRKGFLNLFR